MAGTFLLVIGILLANGMRGLAWAVEALLVLALVALIFGRFCLGSYTFLLFTGRAGLANRTLPWARAEGPPPGSASGSGDGSTSPGAG
jgi:hypothetical protein